MKKIEQTIEQLLKRGTAIVSFDYHDKKRNITIGADLPKALAKRGKPIQGANNSTLTRVNRAVYQNVEGRKMLRAVVQNDDSSPIKNFFLDEIKNFQYSGKVIK